MRWRAVLETAATVAVAAVWFVALRPVALGGPATYIVVHGYSMSGTLAPGDLVITEAQGGYSAGDAIVYRVPSGAGKGLLVVHRIVSVDADGYSMQGDANAFPDPWRPTHADVMGRLVVTIPGLGRFLSSLANPFVLAAVWGLTALIVGMTFLPDPPLSKLRDPAEPPVARRPRQRSAGIAEAEGGGRRARPVHRALEVTTAWALCILIGLVLVSACAVLVPAHAAELSVHSGLVSTRVHLNQSRPGPVPSSRPGIRATRSGARLTPGLPSTL